MPSLPSSLALTNIAASSQILSTTHNSNYSAVQTAVNGVITALSGGAAGQLLYATSSTAVAYSTNVVLDHANSMILFGSGADVNLYRGSSTRLHTDDSFFANGEVKARDGSSNAVVMGTVSGRAGVLFGNSGDCEIGRNAAQTLEIGTSGLGTGVIAWGALATKVKAGVPSDSDLVTGMQVSGAMILDTTNSRIYFRVGSTWKFAALT